FAGSFGLFLFSTIGKRKKELERRQAAQQKARAAKQDAASRVNKASDPGGDLVVLEARVSTAAKQISETDALALQNDFAHLQRLVTAAASDFSSVSNSTTDPDRSGL